MESKFKIIFTGQLKPGTDTNEFIGRFSKLFHVDTAKARLLVEGGKEVVLKKGLDQATADQFREKLEMIGMRVRVEPMASQPAFQPSLAPMVETQMRKAEAAQNQHSATGAETCPKCGSTHIEGDSCLDCGIILSKYRRIMEEHDAASGDDEDPYASPRANLVDAAQKGEMTGPMSVPIGHGWLWLSEGWGYFKRNALAWIGALVIWVGISILAQLVPLVGPLALQVVSAVIMAGFMLGAQAQERGGNFEVGHLFAGFSNNAGQLVLLGVIYLVSMIAIFAVAGVIMGGSLMMGNMEAMEQNPELATQMMSDPTGIALAVLTALALMVPLFMAWFFAPALVAIEGLSALSALKYSFMGCLKNILPFLWYGVIATLLLVLGALPFGLGLLIVGPMFMASIYAAFRDIYYD